MKAWVLHGIGDFRFEEVGEPHLAEDEVLVSVKAAGICGSDIPRIYENGAHRMPLVPGHEFAGEVVKTGSQVDGQWLGSRVGVFPLIPCRTCRPCQDGAYEMCRNYSYLGSRKDGGFAEYVAVPTWNLLRLPEQVSFEEAAMLEPMAVAVHAMRRVEIAPNDTVVVAGLGTIGQLLTMFLLERGIQNILVIGNKEFQKQTAQRLGVCGARYCDSRSEDVRDFIMRHTDAYGADVFFECVGKNQTVSQAIDLAAPAGKICLVGNPYSGMNLEQNTYWKILRHQLRVTGTWNSSFSGTEPDNGALDDWQYVIQKLASKRVAPKKLITHTFSIEELWQGFQIMRDKTQDYIKIMMTAE